MILTGCPAFLYSQEMGKKKKSPGAKDETETGASELVELRAQLDAVVARVAALEIASAARPTPRQRPTRAARVAPPPPVE